MEVSELRHSESPADELLPQLLDGKFALRNYFALLNLIEFIHFQRRKDWLGPRPNRKRKRKQANNKSSTESQSSAAGPSQEASSSTSGFSSQGSQSTADETAPCKSSLPSCSKAAPSNSESSADLCGACGIRRPNGAFMHGKTGHIIYCYPCCKQIWQSKKQSKCPVCRRTIEKVAKMFLATSSPD